MISASFCPHLCGFPHFSRSSKNPHLSNAENKIRKNFSEKNPPKKLLSARQVSTIEDDAEHNYCVRNHPVKRVVTNLPCFRAILKKEKHPVLEQIVSSVDLYFKLLSMKI